ncbi:MAG: Gfo/Idh/MocA family oxidoreductase [Chloroflexi bacterium]|nr:Gfo/Idh/MocA family oxidoreductase [Chloroflexota bacterium]
MIRLGVIGYGGRVQGMLKMIDSLKAGTRLVAITDIRNGQIKQQMIEQERDPAEIRFYSDADEMLDHERLDGVLVGTRCSLHARMGSKVLARNLPLFLEKPIATNMADLVSLKQAGEASASKVVVSFPLRVTPLVQLAKEIIDSGQIGTVEHVQAYNNVPYGGVYYHYWYRDEAETGGLWLQKATHDFDYINYLLNIQPVWISAMTSKQVFKGDHPAGLACLECAEQGTCMESPRNLFLSSAATGRIDELPYPTYQCSFAVDTGNEDSGSALIQYETGMHVAYSQNFYARKGAAARGATLIGYKGTLQFDWYTDELKVFMHHSPRVETHKIDSKAMSHGGGDLVLARSFLDVIQGRVESVSPLQAGLLSVLMCLKAKESAKSHTFQEIRYTG